MIHNQHKMRAYVATSDPLLMGAEFILTEIGEVNSWA